MPMQVPANRMAGFAAGCACKRLAFDLNEPPGGSA